MISHRLNSIAQAAQASRLDTIEIATQRTAFKANGGTVELIGVTTAHTFGIKTQHAIAVMPTQGE